MNRRFEKGMTLMEILVVILLIGTIVAISLAAFSNYLRQYRLSTVTRQLGSAISLTRLKAVSTNMKYTFNLRSDVSPNEYQSTGTNDLDTSGPGVGTLQPWEDMLGTGTIVVDALYKTPQSLTTPTAKIDHQGISTLPNGAAMSRAMDTNTTLNIVFGGRGVPLSLLDNSNVTKDYIVLQGQGLTQAVYVDPTGLVRLYRYVGSTWTEIR